MGKIESLFGTTPAEILESGLENIDKIENIALSVLWKDGNVTVGWSNIDQENLALLILTLEEKMRRTLFDGHDL